MSREVACPPWDGKSDWRYAHWKRDGIWITMIKCADGSVQCWSRTPRNITSVLEWHGVVQSFRYNAPKLTVMYCEAFVAGGSRDDVKGAMKAHNQRLSIECFAIDKFGGNEVHPRMSLEDVQHKSVMCGVSFVPYSLNDQSVDILANARASHSDIEGYVLKDGNLLNWRKVKPEETYDLVIIGFTEAEAGSKWDGLIGSIILADSTGKEVARSSGMSDAVRIDMTHRRDEYVNRLCEVAAQGRGSAGGLMHPRFVRMRDDKSEVDTL